MREITTSEFMCIVEHQAMVEQFFAEKKEFVELLHDAYANKFNVVYEFFKYVAEDMKITEMPFLEEDCDLSVGQACENMTVALMELPITEVNNTTECRFIMVASNDSDPGKARWFTVEKGAVGDEYILCEWAKNSEGELYHINYGKAPEGGVELLDKIVEMCEDLRK